MGGKPAAFMAAWLTYSHVDTKEDHWAKLADAEGDLDLQELCRAWLLESHDGRELLGKELRDEP